MIRRQNSNVFSLKSIVDELCEEKSFKQVFHRNNQDVPMPSREELGEFVNLCRTVLFPGYFGHSEIRSDTMKYYIGTNVDKIFKILAEQIFRGFCFDCMESDRDSDNKACPSCDNRSSDLALKFIERLSTIRSKLATDVQAAYEGDPAAKSTGETIFCYPSIVVMINHRIAHELIELGVPLIPRIIQEMAHSQTGIDIHPGATIGDYFFIDHGTGVVIGETCIIGSHVQIYQGVTLGAKSFPIDENGNPIKGIPRHPIVEDDVIIYSGATILGRITVGKGAVIGGNVWITSDIPPYTKVMQGRPLRELFERGGGI